MNCPFFKTPHLPCPFTSKFFHPLDLGRPVLNKAPSPYDNQWIKRKRRPRMTTLLHIIRPSFRLAFQYQPINLVLLSFDFFSFNWSLTIYFLGVHVPQKRGFKHPKILQNIFYLWLLTFLVLILQSTCSFANIENVNKVWNNNCTVHVKKENQNKSKTESRQV